MLIAVDMSISRFENIPVSFYIRAFKTGVTFSHHMLISTQKRKGSCKTYCNLRNSRAEAMDYSINSSSTCIYMNLTCSLVGMNKHPFHFHIPWRVNTKQVCYGSSDL
ncbi:hypothetical protein IQ13_0951 [Lacibacter cauensis]|uniref:Uncharacterized protein n=1 Tax=Lacibacter cauensis TaxID=510947 RepID=A0A562SX10_9BACT|nr:hypothetical protein IQ13_0951 [Lacibacter cauensis]